MMWVDYVPICVKIKHFDFLTIIFRGSFDFDLFVFNIWLFDFNFPYFSDFAIDLHVQYLGNARVYKLDKNYYEWIYM